MVTDCFKAAGLTRYLDELGFDLVGYGCTTCIGNSGPLLEPIEKAIQQADLTVASVLSGNRNFEGRVHPLVKTNWLASPPLVVAYALAGSVRINLSEEPLGTGKDGQPVYLKDIWPSQKEIAEAIQKVDTEMFHKEYAEVSPATRNGRRSRCRSRTPTSGRPTPPTSSIHPSSNTSPRRRRPSPTSSRRGCWRCWATR